MRNRHYTTTSSHCEKFSQTITPYIFQGIEKPSISSLSLERRGSAGLFLFLVTKSKSTNMEEIVKASELEARLKVTRKTLHNWSENGQMPKKIKLVEGGRSTGWLKSEIDEWLEERLASRGLEEDKK